MAVRYTNLWVRSGALLTANLERHDARDVALVGEELKIEHELRMFVVRVRNTQGFLNDGNGVIGPEAFLCILNPPFHVANCLEIAVDRGLIRRTKLFLEP